MRTRKAYQYRTDGNEPVHVCPGVLVLKEIDNLKSFSDTNNNLITIINTKFHFRNYVRYHKMFTVYCDNMSLLLQKINLKSAASEKTITSQLRKWIKIDFHLYQTPHISACFSFGCNNKIHTNTSRTPNLSESFPDAICIYFRLFKTNMWPDRLFLQWLITVNEIRTFDKLSAINFSSAHAYF